MKYLSLTILLSFFLITSLLGGIRINRLGSSIKHNAEIVSIVDDGSWYNDPIPLGLRCKRKHY